MGQPNSSPFRSLGGAIALMVGLFAIIGYGAVGRSFYGGFLLPQGTGMDFLLPSELGHIALFTVFGVVAMAAIAVALATTFVGDRLVGALRAIRSHERAVAVVAAVGVMAASALIAHFVLGHSVISDDEHSYRFIAQTLRTGSLKAPSPGHDLEFFTEQFVVLDNQARYGKYPIGHPLLLAIGQAAGLEHLVVPVVAGLILLPLWWIASRSFGSTTAVLTAGLFVLSPQVLLTGATYLSQPACGLAVTTGVACLLAAERRTPDARGWLAAAGALFGYAALVRPFPGALFALAALADRARRPEARRQPSRWLALVTPMAGFAAVFMLVNHAQTGGLLTTGYHASYRTEEGLSGGAALIGGNLATLAMSPMAALLRLNAWLLGWPVSLAFCPLVGRSRAATLLWWMVAAEVAYRFVSPKAGIGGVGPIYMFEVVPFLCLLSAEGARRFASGKWPLPLANPREACCLLVAAATVNLTMFLPVKLADLGRMGAAQRVLPRMIERKGLHHALIFAHFAVPPPLMRSWAYFPRFNSPRLDDDVLYVRTHPDPERNLDFWRRSYPDRTAWFFGYANEQPLLIEIDRYVESRRVEAASSPSVQGR